MKAARLENASGTYMQARYYDPVIGRFLSNDPVGFAEGGVDYFNRYSYTANDPGNAIDPDGRVTIFIGGLGDSKSQIVKSFERREGGDNSIYRQQDQVNEAKGIAFVAGLVDKYVADIPINIVGHSLGADTAAVAANSCNCNVDNLVGVDPGPVAFSFRSRFSFRPLSARRR